jgi:hypothetical protein
VATSGHRKTQNEKSLDIFDALPVKGFPRWNSTSEKEIHFTIHACQP